MKLAKVVWVTVDESSDKRTFYVSDQEPGSTGYIDISNQQIPHGDSPALSTYQDLCRHLESIGIDPPAEEYFEPNAREAEYKRTQWTRRVPAVNS